MSASSDSRRLFVALELPDAWRAALEQAQQQQEQASPGYFRWVRADLLHVTVVFLGSQPASRLDDISATLTTAAASSPPFGLSLGQLGTFGLPGPPRVLWAEALQLEGRLQQLRDALEVELRASGVPFDERPLKPHITLGRSRSRPSGRVRLAGVSLHQSPHLVERVVLIESRLTRAQPEYIVRASVELRAAPHSGSDWV